MTHLRCALHQNVRSPKQTESRPPYLLPSLPVRSISPRNSGISSKTHANAAILRLVSDDATNRLTRARVLALTIAIEELASHPPARLIIAGNARFFSAGADLNEIAALWTGAEAYRFAQMGQRLGWRRSRTSRLQASR